VGGDAVRNYISRSAVKEKYVLPSKSLDSKLTIEIFFGS
jgi:hypothetical protein